MTYIPAGASGFPVFTDNFGAALAVPWRTLGTSGTDKTAAPAGGRLVFEGKAGQDCSDYLPRVIIPVPFMPCDIETKLYSYNKGARTVTGIFLGPDGVAGGASTHTCFFDQVNDATDDVIRVEVASGLVAGPTIQTTVPKWFKIRCLGAHLGAQWLFYYSTDGTNWTLFYTRTLATALGALCTGLFIANWFNQPLVQAEYEYLTINPVNQLGPG